MGLGIKDFIGRNIVRPLLVEGPDKAGKFVGKQANKLGKSGWGRALISSTGAGGTIAAFKMLADSKAKPAAQGTYPPNV